MVLGNFILPYGKSLWISFSSDVQLHFTTGQRKGKAGVEIKEYGEDDEHPHRTYDRSIQFSIDGTIAYFCLIAACAAAKRAIGTRNGEQET